MVMAVDQTDTFSPVTPWNGDFEIQLNLRDMGSSDVPTLQSFASAIHNDQWVVLAGRTNGLHNFTNDGMKNFPPASQNSSVWVIDPATRQTWSRSLSDSGSGLGAAAIDSLSATNTQSTQRGDTLFVTGGYVYDSVNNDFTTYNALSAVHLPDLVNWVKTPGSSLAANTIMQTPGAPSGDGTYEGGFFQITGGEMMPIDDRMHLVFGQNFDGPYTPDSNGVYSSQVRSFDIDYNHASGSLSYSNATVSPGPGDDNKYRRRDLNVIPVLSPGPGGGEPEPGIVALAGVFYEGSGIWTVPVEIGADGVPSMTDPESDPDAFKQGMNHYNSANLGLYSKEQGEMTEFLFGGITGNTYDPDTGELVYDSNYPFSGQISAITIDSSGEYQQFFSGEFPEVTDGDGTPLLLGAESQFFPAAELPFLEGGVIDLDALTGETLLGYIFGGIAAEQPNFGDSVASNLIFEVTYAPVPEPARMALFAGFFLMAFVSAGRIRRR